MAELTLSEAQKVYIINSIKKNVRLDGRRNEEYRYMELETDVVPSCHGSARLKIGGTDIVAGIKAEVSDPREGKPNEGFLNFSVFCSAIASPDFEGRGGEAVEERLSSVLANAFESSIDLSKLSILSGKKCWCLYVDVLILGVGGNLCDAASIAVKSALYDTRIPNLIVMKGEGGEGEFEVSEDPYDFTTLDLAGVPCLVTINKIGNSFVVDASFEEEACITSRITVGITKSGTVSVTNQEVPISVNICSVMEMTEIARRIGKALDSDLMEALHREGMHLHGEEDARGFLR